MTEIMVIVEIIGVAKATTETNVTSSFQRVQEVAVGPHQVRLGRAFPHPDLQAKKALKEKGTTLTDVSPEDRLGNV